VNAHIPPLRSAQDTLGGERSRNRRGRRCGHSRWTQLSANLALELEDIRVESKVVIAVGQDYKTQRLAQQTYETNKIAADKHSNQAAAIEALVEAGLERPAEERCRIPSHQVRDVTAVAIGLRSSKWSNSVSFDRGKIYLRPSVSATSCGQYHTHMNSLGLN
jgi:hypothetical protein